MRIFALIFIVVVGLGCLSGCGGKGGEAQKEEEKRQLKKEEKKTSLAPETKEEKAVHGALTGLAVLALLGVVAGGVMCWLSPAKKTGISLAIFSTALLLFSLSLGKNLERWEHWFDTALVVAVVVCVAYAVLTHLRAIKSVVKEIEAEVKS